MAFLSISQLSQATLLCSLAVSNVREGYSSKQEQFFLKALKEAISKVSDSDSRVPESYRSEFYTSLKSITDQYAARLKVNKDQVSSVYSQSSRFWSFINPWSSGGKAKSDLKSISKNLLEVERLAKDIETQVADALRFYGRSPETENALLTMLQYNALTSSFTQRIVHDGYIVPLVEYLVRNKYSSSRAISELKEVLGMIEKEEGRASYRGDVIRITPWAVNLLNTPPAHRKKVLSELLAVYKELTGIFAGKGKYFLLDSDKLSLVAASIHKKGPQTSNVKKLSDIIFALHQSDALNAIHNKVLDRYVHPALSIFNSKDQAQSLALIQAIKTKVDKEFNFSKFSSTQHSQEREEVKWEMATAISARLSKSQNFSEASMNKAVTDSVKIFAAVRDLNPKTFFSNISKQALALIVSGASPEQAQKIASIQMGCSAIACNIPEAHAVVASIWLASGDPVSQETLGLVGTPGYYWNLKATSKKSESSSSSYSANDIMSDYNLMSGGGMDGNIGTPF